MKKLLSLALSAAMVLSMSIVSFAAAATKQVVKIDLDGLTATAAAATELVWNGVTIDFGALAASDALDDVVTGDITATGYVVSKSGTVLVLTADDAGETNDAAVTTVTGTNVTGTIPAAVVTDGTDATGSDAYVLSDIVDTTAYVTDKADLNGVDGVKPGKKIYYIVKAPYNNVDNFEIKGSKGEGAKNIDSVSVQQLKTDKTFYKISDKGVTTVLGTAADQSQGRVTVVEVKLKDNMGSSEYKVSFDLKIKALKATGAFSKGDSFKVEEIGTSWVANQESTGADQNFTVGQGGFVSKPEKNDDNVVEWENSDRVVATLEYTADSDVSKYFPKLSTKWSETTYASNFDGEDAFVFSFVGNPTISAVARPVLTLYNPFVNDDDEYYIAVEDLFVYEEVDGELVDVTAKFKADVNDDGDEVLTLKTRTLGTYIVSAAEAFTSDADVDVDVDVDGGKAVPDTGR